jgi:hypothetical protein
MNKQKIRSRVIEIARVTWDAEKAHSLEDKLYLDFIKHIAEAKGPYSALATEVLRSQELAVKRWYS